MPAKCIIEGCGNDSVCRKMCHKHYSRWQRHGDPHTLVNPWGTPEERFRRYFKPGNPDECWEWSGGRTTHGYGRIQKCGPERKSVGAHRFSYELHKGPIPEGMVVMHTCDNPPCCNPAHLVIGTQKENTHDMMRKGRGNWRAPKGTESPRALLNEEQVRIIKFGNERGVDLAERFGVKPTTISAIRHGRLWRHIDG